MSEQPAIRPGIGAPWSISDAAEFFGVSAKHFRRLIALGKIQSIRLGRRILIPDAEVRRVSNEGV